MIVRSELVAALARSNPDPPVDALKRIMSYLFRTIADQLAKGGRVQARWLL